MDFLTHRYLTHDLLAGRNEQTQESVQLSEAQRSTHLYVCGMSGSGKSRWLQNLIFQDIARGHPVCVIDPMGDLYTRILEYVSSGLELAGERGFDVPELLERFLFLDASDPDTPLRLNPLAPTPDESAEEQVDDILRAFERQTGSMDAQQRRRMILRGIFHMTAELNRLPPERRPKRLPGRHTTFPLNLFFAADILTMTDEERFALLACFPERTRLHFRRLFWEFFAQGSPLEKFRQLQSTFTALQYLLDDDLVLRVFDTHHNIFSLSEILREGKSLICHLPIGGNLTGSSFLGRFLTTKLQQAAYRRPEGEWHRRFYLYLDEFHLFADPAFAESLTNLRKFGISVCVAHQSQTQPPFDTREGQSLLTTMKGNARIHAIFRLSRSDAEIVSRDLFELSQQRENFVAHDTSSSRSTQHTTTTSRSSGHSQGHGGSSSEGVAHSNSSEGTLPSTRHSHGRSHNAQTSHRHQEGTSQTEGTTSTTTSRTIYYPLDGERELMTNFLQKLENRQCYLSLGALQGSIIETPFVPDELYAYQALNFPAQLLDWQRRRVHRLMDEIGMREGAGIEASRILSFPSPAISVPKPPDVLQEEDEGERASPRQQKNAPFVD